MAAFPCRRLRQHDAGKPEPFGRLCFANGFGERIRLSGAGRIDEPVHTDDPADAGLQNEEGKPCAGIHGVVSDAGRFVSALAAAMPSGSSHTRKGPGFAAHSKNEQAWGGFSRLQLVIHKTVCNGHYAKVSAFDGILPIDCVRLFVQYL
jgi:hypothetical protein